MSGGVALFVETVEGVAAAAELYKRRHAVLEMVSRSVQWALRRQINVAVFGAGGAGKSTLGKLLEGTLDTDHNVSPYHETTGTDQFVLAGGVYGKVIVPPGQRDRIMTHWPEILRSITDGQVSRIINVVSSGYLATELETSRLFPGSNALTLDQIRTQFVDDNLRREHEALQHIAPAIKLASGKVKMITFVNKQDLWWSNRERVAEYYKDGAYGVCLNEIQLQKGMENFSHTFVSAALVEQNLRTADGDIIAQTTAGYDDPLRIENLSNSARVIAEMMKS